MEQILYRYNPWWEEYSKPEDVFPRPIILDILRKSLNTSEIIFLTGLRRIGKTTLLKSVIYDLIESGNVKPANIFYVSLDDYSLAKLSIIDIIDEYRKALKLRFSEKIFLFLDEIGYKKEFELQLKNLYDSQNVKIFASSSNSSILRNKKAFITGRQKLIEILPLDFQEYLTFKQIKIGKRDSHLFEKYFEEYLQTGGIPEFVLRGEIDYLRDLVDDIIMKDIAVAYNIKNQFILKDYFLLLMERAGKVFSINKIANILNITPDTAKRYLEYFQSTYLIHLLPRYGKTNERILSAKKIYAADLGIRSLFSGFRDKGSLFENYVYLKIKHRKPAYIYKDGCEIDFLTEDKTLIEVKYNAELNGKQKFLFENTKAMKKFLIRDIRELLSTNL